MFGNAFSIHVINDKQMTIDTLLQINAQWLQLFYNGLKKIIKRVNQPYTFCKPIMAKYVNFEAVCMNCGVVGAHAVYSVLVASVHNTKHTNIVSLNPEFQISSCQTLTCYILRFYDFKEIMCKSFTLRSKLQTALFKN